jgi:hypothetical protein
MPPKSTSRTDNTKAIEKILGNYLKRLLYAHSKDLEIVMGETAADTSHVSFEHYDNLVATENKMTLRARFAPGGRTEQALRMLWEAYVANLSARETDMQVGDSFDRLREKLDDYDEACPGAFVFRVWDKSHKLVRDSKTLLDAHDDGKLRAQFATAFQKFAAAETLMAIIVSTFVGFLRALALEISAMNWYAKAPVEPLFWGFLIANGLTQDHILEWRGNMRPDPERKTKAKKPAADAPVDAAKPVDAPAPVDAAKPVDASTVATPVDPAVVAADISAVIPLH